MKPYTPLIRKFEEAEPYEQDEPGEAKFNWLIKEGEFPGISSGRVRLKGPIHKTPATHDTWDQAYIILKGRAIVHLEDKKLPVIDQSIVLIPRGTYHSVEVKAGEEIEYVFINQYFSS